MSDIISITQEKIHSQIHTIRGKQVMMDRDLAILYGVETKRLNEQVKRNPDRFPTDDFMFELSKEEFENLKSQFATSSWGGLRKLPMVFGEQGIAMLSAVLHSKTAIKISVQIMAAFVEMRKFLKENAEVFMRLENVEHKQSMLQHDTEKKFEQVFNALQNQDSRPQQGVFYEGQVFDAYIFISDLIRSAKHSIVLIDNYVDDTVLSLFTKRAKGVSFTIYTRDISKQLALDKKKHDQQYAPVIIKQFKKSHDRFLILDGTNVYHVGASLKDLGMKWFAFSKMEMSASEILKKLY